MSYQWFGCPTWHTDFCDAHILLLPAGEKSGVAVWLRPDYPDYLPHVDCGWECMYIAGPKVAIYYKGKCFFDRLRRHYCSDPAALAEQLKRHP